MCIALVGCGSGREAARQTTRPCRKVDTAPAIRRLRADVRAIRRAASLPTKDTLKGNRALNAATDRFLLDMATAHVDLLVKNRFIDHAAAALVGSCQQCFQALEAQRPIPSIAHRGRCGS